MTVPLTFRDPDAPDHFPVAEWSFTRLLAAVEHGTALDWHLITTEIEHNPRGKFAEHLSEAVELSTNRQAADRYRRVHLSALAHLRGERQPAQSTSGVQ